LLLLASGGVELLDLPVLVLHELVVLLATAVQRLPCFLERLNFLFISAGQLDGVPLLFFARTVDGFSELLLEHHAVLVYRFV